MVNRSRGSAAFQYAGCLSRQFVGFPASESAKRRVGIFDPALLVGQKNHVGTGLGGHPQPQYLMLSGLAFRYVGP